MRALFPACIVNALRIRPAIILGGSEFGGTNTVRDLVADIRSRSCGWFLDADTEGAAVQAIREFLSAPLDRLREMGSRGRAWALDNTSMNRFQSRLNNLMREVVGHD